MTAGRAALVHAYVLHQRGYRETSMLVEALTLDAGRIGLVARGARRAGSRTRALLEPFQPLLLSWSGRGELHTLVGVESAGWRPPPAGPALLAGFYCSELVLRLLGRDDPNPAVFAAYDRAVADLAGADAPTEGPLRRFELELLGALGYAPPLGIDMASGDPVRDDLEYDFLPEQGPVSAAGSRREGIVRVPGSHLRAMAEQRLDDPAVLQSARRVLRASLQPHLGRRPLHSRALYRSMYGRGDAK